MWKIDKAGNACHSCPQRILSHTHLKYRIMLCNACQTPVAPAFSGISESIAWHDLEAERSSPDRCEGGSEEKICPRIGQSVTVIGQDKAILILFALSREDVSLMLGIRPSFWTLPIMRGNNA
jgi:hypothetical protein